MLSNLQIENIAVIKSASIDFENGFNVMTGETGAGKSIVIDSLNAILGERTSRELIRSGADSASVCAEFQNVGDNVKNERENTMPNTILKRKPRKKYVIKSKPSVCPKQSFCHFATLLSP